MPVEIWGLHVGEMDADQLWETSLNPETRVLKQITMNDAEKVEKILETLMGKDVEPRRKFIERNAQYADLDM